MAVHYLLDGYNIIKQVPALANQRWEDGRASLVKIIEKENLPGSVNNQLTIIFDGRPGWVDTPGTLRVKVMFTGDRSADDQIKKIVAESQNKKSYVVVTDDRDIQYCVRSLGAKVLKVSAFLSKSKSHQDKAYVSQDSTDRENTKVIPKTVEHQITTELEQLWLGKNLPDGQGKQEKNKNV